MTDRDAEGSLADRLGMNVEQLVKVVPAPVRALPPDIQTHPEPRLPNDIEWFAAGDAILVLIGFDVASSEIVVARPYVGWDGAWPSFVVAREESRYAITDTVFVDWFRTRVGEVVEARRFLFCHCHRCGRSYPPEHMFHADRKCHGCTQADGVVF